jgi:hypothetical protein
MKLFLFLVPSTLQPFVYAVAGLLADSSDIVPIPRVAHHFALALSCNSYDEGHLLNPMLAHLDSTSTPPQTGCHV